MVTIDHLWETPHGESDGHMIDGITWPQRSRSWPQYIPGWISQ